jgi:protease-4
MGNTAASGGYYVASGANAIFADPNTITGSIGVWGGKLVTTAGWNSLGINWHADQRGEMAGMFSSRTLFSDKERLKIKDRMESTYEQFKDHVVNGRSKRLTKPIEEIAGGRVFTGTQALELGLVDKIGGLEDAIRFAAQKAGIGDYDVQVIPEPMSIMELLFNSVSGDGLAQSSIIDVSVLRSLKETDPLRMQAVLSQIQCLELVNKEGVIMMTSNGIVVPK